MKVKSFLSGLLAVSILLSLAACGPAVEPTEPLPVSAEAPETAETPESTAAPETTEPVTKAPRPTSPPPTVPQPTTSAHLTTQKGAKGKGNGPADGEWVRGRTAVAWKTYTYAGQEVCRRYYYYIPGSYTPGNPLPLMITLPGTGTSALFQLGEGNWTEIAERDGLIIIAPEYVCLHADGQLSAQGFTQLQIGQSDNANMRWVATSVVEPVALYGVNDVRYLTDLMDVFIEAGLADEHRIFACGLSHGAYMAERLAIEAPQRLAGVGLVAAGVYWTFQNNTLSNKVRVVFVQGTNDPVVPFAGIQANGVTVSLSLNDSVKWFLSRYGVSEKAEVTELEDTVPEDGCRITRTEYRSEDGTPQVIKYVVTGGGHTWPGGTQYLPEAYVGKLCRDAQAAELIWADLKDATNEGTALH